MDRNGDRQIDMIDIKRQICRDVRNDREMIERWLVRLREIIVR